MKQQAKVCGVPCLTCPETCNVRGAHMEHGHDQDGPIRHRDYRTTWPNQTPLETMGFCQVCELREPWILAKQRDGTRTPTCSPCFTKAALHPVRT